MALEIRELVVKVSVTEEHRAEKGKMSERDKSKLVNECVKKVIKQLKQKNKR
ncbi:MAG: DUF5908 family protein [Reichenbachiella sp.]|uniref:DUF5908 family protein n=1 Tax=Reichenbachiella sp. TaxID=2184521 RepID=UPI0032662F2E